MNILFLSRWFPWPADNGSKIRIINLLRCLAQEHTIDIVSFADHAISPEQIANLEQFCRQIKTVAYHSFQPTRLKALMGLFSPIPRSILDTNSPEFRIAVQQLTQHQRYDAVIASQIDMAAYALAIPRQYATIRILEEIEITTLYEQQTNAISSFSRARRALMWQKWLHYLNRLLPHFDTYTTVSEPEQQRLAGFLNPKITTPGVVIPNGVDLSRYRDINISPRPDTLIYSGALSFNANFDAVTYFLSDILPIIVLQHPKVSFRITGKTDGIALDKLPLSPHVTFTGYLPDIRPAIAESWLNVVPLRIGGGTRLKILESMASGTPVIATQKGAEGLELVADREIVLANQPEEFASRTIQYLSDPILRNELSRNGKKAVEKYDWSLVGGKLLQLVESLTRQRNGTTE
jgi:polysaccharide biosynthesis protein PslH